MRTTLATLAAVAAIVTTPAHAQGITAVLLSCEMGTSITGLPVWVGLYEANGQQFTRSFSSYCPATLQVR